MPPDRSPRLTPPQLRALAHPLRLRIVAALRRDGPDTATGLAAKLGENTGATSYHLRRLAASGFVEEVREREAGRRRWWQAAMQRHSVYIGDYADLPEFSGDLDMYLHEVLSLYTHDAGNWLAERDSWGPQWVDAAEMSDLGLRLSPARLRALNDELFAVVDRYRTRADEAAAAEAARAGHSDAELVEVIVMSFPRHGPARPHEPHPQAEA